MAKDKPAGEAAGEPTAANAQSVAPAVENGVRVEAPNGMHTISVGGVSFARDDDGYFVLPVILATAAKAHIRSFEAVAERDARRAIEEAKRLEREADIPGRIKALEARLGELEATLGIGVNRG